MRTTLYVQDSFFYLSAIEPRNRKKTVLRFRDVFVTFSLRFRDENFAFFAIWRRWRILKRPIWAMFQANGSEQSMNITINPWLLRLTLLLDKSCCWLLIILMVKVTNFFISSKNAYLFNRDATTWNRTWTRQAPNTVIKTTINDISTKVYPWDKSWVRRKVLNFVESSKNHLFKTASYVFVTFSRRFCDENFSKIPFIYGFQAILL